MVPSCPRAPVSRDVAVSVPGFWWDSRSPSRGQVQPFLPSPSAVAVTPVVALPLPPFPTLSSSSTADAVPRQPQGPPELFGDSPRAAAGIR